MCKKVRWNIDCKEATLLMELEHARSLSVWGKFRLQIHLWTCQSCRKFKENWQILSTRIKTLAKTGLNQFTDQEKKALQKKIEQNL